VESQLTLTPTVKWTRGANRGLGIDGLWITPAGLKIDLDTLLETCRAYAQGARRRSGPLERLSTSEGHLSSQAMRRRAAMTPRGPKISDLAAVAAVVGALALLGIWDNERTIHRNLDAGYDTSAMITGANEHRRSPLTFDGLRPRFADEPYSLDLTWRGRDGIEHARQKVPVSRDYMASLMVGDKVRLVPVPIKVVDEPEAVPTITPDATARLYHLHLFATWAGYGTAGVAFIFVVGLAGRWLRRNRSATAAR
jgi:hypothetical protein